MSRRLVTSRKSAYCARQAAEKHFYRKILVRIPAALLRGDLHTEMRFPP